MIQDEDDFVHKLCPQHYKRIYAYCLGSCCEVSTKLVCIECNPLHVSHIKDCKDFDCLCKFMQNRNEEIIKFQSRLTKIQEEIMEKFLKQFGKLATQFKSYSLDKLKTMTYSNLNDYIGFLPKLIDKIKDFSIVIEKQFDDIKNKIANCEQSIALPEMGKFEIITEADFENSKKLYNKGIEQLNQSQYDEAIKNFESALTYNPLNFNAIFCQAESLRMEGKYDKAIHLCEKILKIDPNNCSLLKSKGSSLRMKGLNRDSITCFDQVLKINPQDVFSLYNKGEALRKIYQYSEAITILDKALAIDQNDYQSLGSKGSCLISEGKYAQAKQCFEQALKIEPQDSFALDQLSNIILDLELCEERIKMSQIHV